MSNPVVLPTAPRPHRPLVGPTELFSADKPGSNAYDAVSHAEFKEQNGKVLYFTFSRSNGLGLFGAEFALVRVTLP